VYDSMSVSAPGSGVSASSVMRSSVSMSAKDEFWALGKGALGGLTRNRSTIVILERGGAIGENQERNRGLCQTNHNQKKTQAQNNHPRQ